MISFMGILAILFIGLKLTGFIAWSWWLVLLPIYFGLAVAASILLFTGGAAVILYMLQRIFK